MTDLELALLDVIANRDDDAPRLRMADLLDDHGECARAEFIRVQIELAREVPGGVAMERIYVEGFGNTPMELKGQVRERAMWLQRREHELLTSSHKPNGNFTDRLRNSTRWGPAMTLRGGFNGEHFYRRGFTNHLKMTAAFCIAHLDTIIKQHPIASVELTTWPGGNPTYIDLMNNLAAEWPGIEFTLPQSTGHNYASSRAALDQFTRRLMPSGVR
jgi:uncharacterized protein (TIGR02996 family)